MKKNLILVSSTLLLSSGLTATHNNYDNYTGKKFVTYGNASLTNNHHIGAQCSSIRMYPKHRLLDVGLFASNLEAAPKIQLKIYTRAPVGSKVELHLAKRGECSYPKGVHSVFEAYTRNLDGWEHLVFNFTHMPKESIVKPTEIDQLVLFFALEYPVYAVRNYLV